MNQVNPRKRNRRRGGGYRPRPLNPDGTPVVILPVGGVLPPPAIEGEEGEGAPDSDLMEGAEAGLENGEAPGTPLDSVTPTAEGAPSTEDGSPAPAEPTNGHTPRPQPGLLTLERRCVRQFPRIALSRGRQYFVSGRLGNPTWAEKKCEVEIQGLGGNYKTTFDFTNVAENRRLPAHCNCPAYERGVLCKHLWAAILQIDKITPTSTVPESGPLKLLHSQPRPRGPVQARGGHHPQERGLPPAAWLSRLNQLQGMSAIAATRINPISASAYFVIAAADTSQHGKLVLDLWRRNRAMNGEMGPLRPHLISNRDFSHFAEVKDQEILSLLMKTGEPQVFAPFGRSSQNVSSRFTVDPIFESHLIPMLANAGKLFLSRSPNGSPDSAERPLRMDRSAAWEFELKLENTAGENYKLDGLLRRDGELRVLSWPFAIFRSGFLLFDDRVGRFAEPAHAIWASSLRNSTDFLIPKTEGDALLTRLLLDPNAPRLTWPAELGWSTTKIEPRPRGVFHPLGNDASTGRLTLNVSFDYDGKEVALSENQKTLVDVAKKQVYVRNVDFEEKTLLRALEILRDPQGTGSVAVNDLHRAASELCRDGWSIHIENQKIRVPDEFFMNVSSNTDWFDLKLEASFGDTAVSESELMAALESKSGLVKLADGSLGMLPQEWLAKYASVTEFGTKTDEGTFRFSRSQGLMLNNVLSDDKHLKTDQGFATFREKVRKFEGVQAAAAPEGFHGELRNYQREGLTWLKFLEEFETGGILADDMGLGKTIQILAFLKSRARQEGKPSLVVTPKSLAFNWFDEAAKFVPDLKVVRYAGAGRSKLMEEIGGADLVITTYGTLRTDIELLRETEFDVAIVDEAQAIKNAKSKSALACKKIKARHKIALTGTPIENSLNDLLSILAFTNPGLLGAHHQEGVSNRDTQAVLARMLKPFMLRRTKEKVLTELPAKSEQVLFCEMSTTERQFYNAIREKYRDSLAKKIEKGGMGAAKLHVLEALLRLRQAACHSGLVEEERREEPSAKLELLLEQIKEVTSQGHKALVFSQFTSLLALVRTQLDNEKITYEYLDGKTTDRKSPVERFQTDAECRVFLISLKAGGTGLNLTAADYVFILDPWWNPAVEAQAIGRAHRMGQSQKVFAYRMIARGTVEEKILELQKTKRDLAESIISEDQDFVTKLTRDDLEMLLS